MKTRTKQAYMVFLFVVICITVMCGCSQKKALSFETTYAIDADLDPEMRRMTYAETVEVINMGSDSTKTLYFHIYGNKFKGLRQVEDGDIVVLSAYDQNGNALQWQREQEGVLYCVELAQKLEPGQSMELTFACKDYVLLERTVGNTEILGYFNETVDSVTRQRMEYVMDCAAFSLEYFNGTFVEYPYDTLVVTNSALGTNFSPNMEYSGLITILFDSQQISMKTNTFHEVAHQWFYGLVGNDENQEPWLDEGFSEFAAGLCLDADGNTDFLYWELKDIASNGAADEKVNVSSDEASVYQWVIYDRGAMFLKTLMDAVGQEEFLSILSEYCQKYRYGVVTTESFLEILHEGTDVDISDIVTEFIK